MTYEPHYTEAGVATFRVFSYAPVEGESPLRSLYSNHCWTAEEQVAHQVPSGLNRAGFYGWKSYEDAVHYSRGLPRSIIALMRQRGKAVEGEIGLRTLKAQIVAFIKPELAAENTFPREHLQSYFPEVPIISPSEAPAMIEELDLEVWPKKKPFPLVQWLSPPGELIWAAENAGPSSALPDAMEYEMLEPAASYPRELHPVDQRLRKGSYRAPSGQTYMYWYLGGTESSFAVAKEVLYLLQTDADLMTLHLTTESQERS
jgi:hypothetical protein